MTFCAEGLKPLDLSDHSIIPQPRILKYVFFHLSSTKISNRPEAMDIGYFLTSATVSSPGNHSCTTVPGAGAPEAHLNNS